MEIWTVNSDASMDWLTAFRAEYSLSLPILKNADVAFESFRLGYEYQAAPPLFVVIDKHGIIRHRSLGRGSISIEAVGEMIDELLEE